MTVDIGGIFGPDYLSRVPMEDLSQLQHYFYRTFLILDFVAFHGKQKVSESQKRTNNTLV